MSYNRRKFLRKGSQLAGITALSSLVNPALGMQMEAALERVADLTPEELAKDETFWYQVRQAYTVSATTVNLNNGGVSPQPRVVQEAVEYYNKKSNELPTHFMWRVMDPERKIAKDKLALLAGCSSEEIAIHRNATESLETIIFGLRLQPGDEVVLSRQDYPNMINAWKQRALREGIVLKWLDWELPLEDNSQIVGRFKEMFNEKTKVVHLTHVVNWTGQIFPVKAIAREAHARGIEVVVDGAHSFAHLSYRIPDLGCDYYGTSLHKWLCAPFGTGMLYVKKEKIKNLFPLFACDEPESATIDKFEAIGTRSEALELAIAHAIDFHEMIGAERKHQRLLYLRDYWMDRVKDVPNIVFHTSQKPDISSAICLFSIKNTTASKIYNYLMKHHRIHVTIVNRPNVNGVRVTPNIYTLTKELDRFVTALKTFKK